MHVILGLVAVLGVGSAAWLLWNRSRLASDAAEARARLEQVQAEAARQAEQREREQLAAAARLESVEASLARASADAATLRTQVATLTSDLEHERQRMADELRQRDELVEVERGAMRKAEQQMRADHAAQLADLSTRFDALASRALTKASDEFLKRAEERLAGERTRASGELELKRQAFEELIKPIAQTLTRTDAKLAEIDRSRAESAASIAEQLRGVARAHESLREETGRLVKALREPHVRGRYGEWQLKRVAELAGMVEHCDFALQEQTVDAEGRALRPDMVVKLPSGRVIVVDAKTNIQAYIDATQESSVDAAEAHLSRFARHVAEQAAALGKKRYWTQYEGSPEFVVMFMPGDQFLDAALSRQPEMLESAARQGVLLASPATLIGLLRAVAVGYKEERLAQAAAELRELGIEFHDRAATAYGHIARVGASLNQAVERYNEFVGSYEKRLEPTLKKFQDQGAGSAKALPTVEVIDTRARVKGDPQRLLLEGEGA